MKPSSDISIRCLEAMDYQSVIDSIHSEIAILNHQGIIIATNRAWKRFEKDSKSQLAKSRWDIGSDYLAVCEGITVQTEGKSLSLDKKIKHVIDTDDASFTHEYPCHSPYAKRWFSMCISHLSGIGATIVHHEITERYLAEQDAVESFDLLISAINQIPSGIIVADAPSGEITLCNQAALNIRGASEMTLTHIDYQEHPSAWNIFKPDGSPFVAEELPLSRALLKGEKVSNEKAIIKNRNGELRWVVANSSPVNNRDGKIISAIVVFHDITELLILQQELAENINNLESLVQTRTNQLEAALNRAELAKAAKSNFLSNMSHEIRTPLHAIQGYSHILKKKLDTPEPLNYVEKIISSSTHLMEAVNAILDISKLESGKYTTTEIPFDLEIMVDEAKMLVSGKTETLAFQIINQSTHRQLMGDPLVLKQCLINYFSNAIKFGNDEMVTLLIEEVDCKKNEIMLKFSVSNQGPEIPLQDIPRLFSMFEQIDNSMTRKHGGTGLGLAITKRFSEMMGGSAGVINNPGKGCTFWFSAKLRTP